MSITSCVYAAEAGAVTPASQAYLTSAVKQQLKKGTTGQASVQRIYNYLLDVPVSTAEVERWERDLTAEAAAKIGPSSGLSVAVGIERDVSTAASFTTAQAIFAMETDDFRRGAVHKLAPFPSFQADAVATLPMTRVLKLRREWLPHRQRFPVHQQRTELLDALLNSPLVALVAAGGSGKTLQVPLVLSETDAFKRRRIVLVAANEVAAQLTVRRLREERGEDALTSRTVACVLPLECEATQGTSIIVTTAPVLRSQLLCDPTLVDVGCLIFDDVHMRNEATEMCFAMVRDVLLASAAPSHNTAAGGNAAAAAVRRLRVVVACPDEQCAAPLMEFFSSCRPTMFTVSSTVGGVTAAASSSATAQQAAVLYVEEAVQWLAKCDKEGSSLCQDPDRELARYASDVDVVTRVLETVDADFTDPVKCRRYWCDIIAKSIYNFDVADRAARSGDDANVLPAVVVVAPSQAALELIQQEMHERLSGAATEGEEGEEEEEKQQGESARKSSVSSSALGSFAVSVLSESVTLFNEFLAVAQRGVVTNAQQRWVLLCTSDMAQTVLPSAVDVGLVVDCARITHRSLDLTSMSDVWVTEYASIGALRARRSIAKLSSSMSVASGEAASIAPMVIQLIPKSILHSVEHRRRSVDPAQHIVFRLPMERYVQLYQFFQARTEAASFASSSPVSATPSVVGRIAQLVASHLVTVPAASSNRYEPLRRMLSSIEAYLMAASHISVAHAASATGTEGPALVCMRPLGVLTVCLPMPFSLARLLAHASLLGCTLEATVIAALWASGDLFRARTRGAAQREHGKEEDEGKSVEEEQEEEDFGGPEEHRALLREARLYFSRDSLSDTVSAFNIFRMWADIRASEQVDAEKAFYAECGVSRALMVEVAQVQASLYLLTKRLRLSADGNAGGDEASFPTRSEDVRKALTRRVAACADNAAVSSVVRACVSAALYPNCAVPTASGSVLLLDGVHCDSSSSSSALIIARRTGVYAENSVLSDADCMKQAAGKPFLFLMKTLCDTRLMTAANAAAAATAGAPTNAASLPPLAILEHGTSLDSAASIVFCGEGHERPKAPPVRCRGWTTSLTNAWRQTKRARLLPPPSQLAPASIPVQPYDTVRSKLVVVSTDHSFTYTTRATAARWLLHLRSIVKAHLTALTERGRRDWDPAASAKVIAGAWNWWCRREDSGRAWLRTERAIMRSNATSLTSASAETESKEGTCLYPYYGFQTHPGKPAAVSVPAPMEAAAAVQATAAAAAAEGLVGDQQPQAQQNQPTVYTGKRPSADAEHVFIMCVKSVAANRSRESEAQLLRDEPEMFHFLNPEDEFHEYYLYLLKQAAPDLEILGDSLEELLKYLQNLETELRFDMGLPSVEEEQQAALLLQQQQQQEQQQYTGMLGAAGSYQVQEVTGVTDMEEAQEGWGGGLQMEMSAVNLRKAAAPTFAPIATTTAPSTATAKKKEASAASNPTKQDRAHPASENTEPVNIGKFTFATPTDGSQNTTQGKDSNQQQQQHGAGGGATLMEKLMAMQAAQKPPAESTANTEASRTAELFAAIGAPSTSAVNTTEASAVASPPTTAELLALLAAPQPFSTIPANSMTEVAGNGVIGASASSATGPSPLTRPPPPLPARSIEERTPSVVVYPVPGHKYDNVPATLARALGETLGMRVGPTKIVGHVARITLPNRNVEARALALKTFTCVGKTIYIFKNDRIIDNPELVKSSNAYDARAADSNAPFSPPDISTMMAMIAPGGVLPPGPVFSPPPPSPPPVYGGGTGHFMGSGIYGMMPAPAAAPYAAMPPMSAAPAEYTVAENMYNDDDDDDVTAPPRV